MRGRRSSIGTGEYLVTLQVDGQIYRQVLQVVADPEFEDPATSREEEMFWDAFLGVEEESSAEDGEAGRLDS